jgi:hypothetical protein
MVAGHLVSSAVQSRTVPCFAQADIRAFAEQVPTLRKFLMAKKRKISIEILTPATADHGLLEEVGSVDPATLTLEDADRAVVRLFRLGKDDDDEDCQDDGRFIFDKA